MACFVPHIKPYVNLDLGNQVFIQTQRCSFEYSFSYLSWFGCPSYTGASTRSAASSVQLILLAMIMLIPLMAFWRSDREIDRESRPSRRGPNWARHSTRTKYRIDTVKTPRETLTFLLLAPSQNYDYTVDSPNEDQRNSHNRNNCLVQTLKHSNSKKQTCKQLPFHLTNSKLHITFRLTDI
ncbi:hypothetical protein SAY86_004614 [Trapa natans]|uniref:Uncharacterized protein n=1 Tax=Trapa natans TaxID=22666 RepID=A0AAN7RI35_TRANT|nr:hypothetical protein SAY86_004614 [Trapa natans]